MKKIFCLSLLLNLMFFNTLCFANLSPSQEYKHPCYNKLYLDEDKYEKINRKIFNTNLKLNNIIARKVHVLWASLLPLFVIDALNCAYSNIEYPKRVVSSLLQKDFDAIKHESKRFLINSTLGIAGLLDVAKKYFDLEMYNEDMEQALACCKVKCGSYLVLPFISSTTSRDVFGRIFDFLLNPTTYIATPITAIVKMGLLINRTAYIQPILKMVQSNFVDPYDIARKFFGVEKYIKLSNYDRKEVLSNIKENYDEIELVDSSKSNLQVKGKIENSENLIVNEYLDKELDADILLSDYNSQNPVLDSMRTALYDVKNGKKNFWHELSFWNNDFSKKIKTANITLSPDNKKYKIKYLLQKNKTSPLVIIFPSIGEGVNNSHSTVLAQTFFAEGYSVLILGSHFQWEFLNSIDKEHKLGNIKEDIKYINLLINNSIEYLSKKYDRVFLQRTAIGTSLGGYSVLFLANSQFEDGANNIDKFISICPPFELLYAISQIDEIIDSVQKYPDDLKQKVAITSAKVIRALNNKEKIIKDFDALPFSNYEAKLISAFIFHQKLSDLIYATEKRNASNFNHKDFYEMAYKMNFSDYINKYLLVNNSRDELKEITSLASLSNYFINKDNYIIFHSLDDYLTNKNQLKELKSYCEDKLVLFSNGAHLGFLYRDEFHNALKKQISLN